MRFLWRKGWIIVLKGYLALSWDLCGRDFKISVRFSRQGPIEPLTLAMLFRCHQHVHRKLDVYAGREAILQGANDGASRLAVQTPIADEDFERVFDLLNGFGWDKYRAELAKRKWFGLALLGMSNTLW